jgi:hypothetical protein
MYLYTYEYSDTRMSSWLSNFRCEVRTNLSLLKEHEKMNEKNDHEKSSDFNEYDYNFSSKKGNVKKGRMTITDCVQLIGILYDDMMTDEKKLKKRDENGHFKLTNKINSVRENNRTYDAPTLHDTCDSNINVNHINRSFNDKGMNSKIYPTWEKYTMEERTYITVQRKYGLRKIAVEKVAKFLRCLEFHKGSWGSRKAGNGGKGVVVYSSSNVNSSRSDNHSYINNIHHHHGNSDYKNDDKSLTYYTRTDEENNIDIISREKKRIKNEIRSKDILELKVFYSIFKNEIDIYYLLLQSEFMKILNRLILIIIKSNGSNTTQMSTHTTSDHSYDSNNANRNKNKNSKNIDNINNNLSAISTSINHHTNKNNFKNVKDLISPPSMSTSFTSTYKSITFLNNDYDYNDNNNINNNNINNKKIGNHNSNNRGIDMNKNADNITEDFDVNFTVKTWVNEVLSFVFNPKDCCMLEQLLLLSSPQVALILLPLPPTTNIYVYNRYS